METSTASFSRCSGILLAGSKIGKSEGIELSMGSTVTIKDMTTLEEFIFINTLHQCQSVWFGGGGGGGLNGESVYCYMQRTLTQNLKSFFRLNKGFYLAKARVTDPHKKSLHKV